MTITKEEYKKQLYKKYNVSSYLELRKAMTDAEFDGLISLRSESELLSDPQECSRAKAEYTKWHYRKVQ